MIERKKRRSTVDFHLAQDLGYTIRCRTTCMGHAPDLVKYLPGERFRVILNR